MSSRKAVKPTANQSRVENESHSTAQTGNEKFRAATSPRAAGNATEDTQTSPSGSPSSNTDAAVLEALARRKVWAEPRRSALQPEKVQDPAGERAAEQRGQSLPVDKPGAQAFASIPVARESEPAEPSHNEDLIREALRNRGQPYVWGGASRGGFDCSGFMCYLFARQRNIKLPHSASAQARMGSPVKSDELQAGDLVFFSTYRRSISHVGMYVGDGKFIHAANTRRDVRIDTLKSGYYAKRLKAARRLTPSPIRLTPTELEALTRDSSVLPMVPKP